MSRIRQIDPTLRISNLADVLPPLSPGRSRQIRGGLHPRHCSSGGAALWQAGLLQTIKYASSAARRSHPSAWSRETTFAWTQGRSLTAQRSNRTIPTHIFHNYLTVHDHEFSPPLWHGVVTFARQGFSICYCRWECAQMVSDILNPSRCCLLGNPRDNCGWHSTVEIVLSLEPRSDLLDHFAASGIVSWSVLLNRHLPAVAVRLNGNRHVGRPLRKCPPFRP